MLTRKPLLVFILLVVASLACYSDNPLWFPGITEVPPTSTFLPTPDPTLYPTRLSTDQLALAPRPAQQDQPFFFLTRLPQELLPGVRNASGSCEYGSSVEIFYAGQYYENFKGDIYVDNITGTTADGAEVLFDFESGQAEWSRPEQPKAITGVTKTTGVNFNSLRRAPKEDEEEDDLPEVDNTTSVLKISVDYGGDNWKAETFLSLDPGADWSDYTSVTAEVFAPKSNDLLEASLFVRAGTLEFVAERQRLNPGEWNVIEFELSDEIEKSDIRTVGIRVGLAPTRNYYLVTCGGAVGWTGEDRLAGPVAFARGQSAMTKNLNRTGQPYPTTENVYEVNDSLTTPFPSQKKCDVGEVVDIVEVSAAQDMRGEQVIWYRIQCENVTGWVTEDRLLGPLVLPAVGGLGVVAGDSPIDLAAEVGPPSDENPVVGTCASDQTFVTTDFVNVGEDEDKFEPYYQIQCGEQPLGWTLQAPLVEIPHALGTFTLIIGDEDLGQVIAAEEDNGEPSEDDTEETAGPSFLPVPVTNVAERAVEGNIVGDCPSGTIAQLEDVRTFAGSVFYQITCNEDLSGWVESVYLPNEVEYGPDTTFWFVSPSLTGRGVPEDGFAIHDQPDTVAPTIGQCELFTPATINDASFEAKALRSLGFRLYYQVTCTSTREEEITGWVEAEKIRDAISLRDPVQLIGG